MLGVDVGVAASLSNDCSFRSRFVVVVVDDGSCSPPASCECGSFLRQLFDSLLVALLLLLLLLLLFDDDVAVAVCDSAPPAEEFEAAAAAAALDEEARLN